MSIGRQLLTLGKKKADDVPDTEVVVPVGIFDVQLPARQFVIRHKVAAVGEVSLTTEFLLRLLHSIDGMGEEEVASFFGFDAGEMAFVVDEAEARAFVRRQGGRLWLTDAAYALFKDGDKPQIYEVQKRSEKVGFDLLSLAPCERDFLSPFERALPELEIRDAELAANASKHVPQAFRRFYGEIFNRREKDPLDVLKRSLYSVDEVVAGDRFPALVPVVAMANVRKPGDPEPMLDAWHSGHEIGDRDEVVHAVAAFLDNLKVTRSREDTNAYELLAEFAPDYLREYVTKQGVNVLRFFKETASRAGELRSNRQTVGIVGSLYAPENSKRVWTAIGYATTPDHHNDDAFLWLIPNQSTWGASRAFTNFFDKLKCEGMPEVGAKHKAERTPIMISCGKPAWHLVKYLPKTLDRPDNGSVPSSLEVLLIPQRMVAVTVHAPVMEGRGFPVPLGVLSFDPAVVGRVHDYLKAQLPSRLNEHDGDVSRDIHGLLRWKIPEQPAPGAGC